MEKENLYDIVKNTLFNFEIFYKFVYIHVLTKAFLCVFDSIDKPGNVDVTQ